MAKTLNCMLCKIVITCNGRDLTRFNSHMELEHGVYFRLNLVMCLNFLSEEEVTQLTDKLGPRLELFLEKGEMTQGGNIFEANLSSMRPNQPEIQKILNQNLEGTTVSKHARKPPPGPPSDGEKEQKRQKLEEEFLLVESDLKANFENDDDKTTLSEKLESGESLNDTEETKDDSTQRRLILEDLKSMIVSASTATNRQEVKTQHKPDIDIDSVTTVSTDDKSVQCTLCFSTLSSLSNVRRHERRYHQDHLHLLRDNFSNKDHVHQCDYCHVKLLTENLYAVHFIKNHLKESFQCKKCSVVIDGKHKIERVEEHLNLCKDLKHKTEYTIRPCKINMENINFTANIGDVKQEIVDPVKKLELLDVEESNKKTEEINVKIEIEETNIVEDKPTEESMAHTIICRLCYTKLSSQANLKRHEQTVHLDDQAALSVTDFTKADLIYNCDMCPLQFLTENILNTHKKMQHRITVKSASAQCKICQKILTIKSLKGHMQTHDTEKSLECKLCYLKFKQQKSLSSHTSNVHKNDEMLNKEITEGDLKFNCDQCEYKFVSEEILKGHIQRHENSKFEFLRNESFDEIEQHFNCKLCYKTFKEFHKMKSHIIVNHRDDIEAVFRTITDEELTHKCDKCSYTFISKPVLQYHVYRTHGGVGTPYSQPRDQLFLSNAKVNVVQRLDCKLCYTEFLRPEMLKAHEESVHKFDTELLSKEVREEDLIYPCEICHLNFVTENIMMVHRRISFCEIKK